MKDVKLTNMTAAAGWAAKIGPETLAQVLCDLPKFYSDKLIVGIETSDDAAVYKMNDEQAIIQTLDFFTPIVDDPYMFGQIAAANSLSDVYAMGGKPIIALNIVGFPDCLDTSILKEILRGGADKVMEAGALLVGGHTVSDDEPKYGLSVTGEVHPDKVLTNAGAQVGDVLVLTKPIGTGILNTAIKADMLSEDVIDLVTDTMRTLNKVAADPLHDLEIHACTDVTGFGLAGHAYEMADGSNLTIEIDYEKVPILPQVIENANMGLIPAGTYRNKSYMSENILFTQSEDFYKDVMFDPQTSGGLLIALPEKDLDTLLSYYKEHLTTAYAVVGRVVEKKNTH